MNYQFTVDLDDFSFDEGGSSIGNATTILPHLVPIPVGVNYYPTDRSMVRSELAFGSPHFIDLQVGVRL